MGQRQLTLLGRIGMVLFVSGLALGLVSLIPSYSYSGYPSQLQLNAQKYTTVSTGVYTPQVGISISLESNGSVYLCLLSVRSSELYNWTLAWVTENYPDLHGFDLYLSTSNLTVLDAVLELHPGMVLWNSSMSKNLSLEFYPTSVLNVTAIVGNPSDNTVSFQVVSKGITALAPKGRVSLAAVFLIPVGLVLAAPWAIKAKLRKKAPVE